MQYNFSNKKYLIRIERLFECQQLRLTQTLCTIENSKQRPRWMTQAKRSQCEWSVIQLREQSFNCFDCQSMYIVWDTKHIHFFSDNKIYNIVQPKALPWQMRYKLSGTNDHDWPPVPHESTSEICVCAGENGVGGSRCQAVTIYIIKPWVKWLCPCRKHRMLINLCMKVIR